MRPIFLTIAGLNSYIEQQTIDFTTLTKYGIFGITGPTGSGKSSILDAITLSLYGEMERGRDDFINSHSNEARVSFEFEIRGIKTSRYKVERRYKRQKNGSQSNIYAVLSEKNGDIYTPLTEKSKETNQAVFEILGLKYEDFKRAVMLPQGKFSEFLMLKEAERNAMLERILSYEHLGATLREKIKKRYDEESMSLLTLQNQINFYKDATEENLQNLNKEKSDLAKGIENIQREQTVLNEALEKMKINYGLQQELKQFLEKKKQEIKRLNEIEKQKGILALAKKAKELNPYIKKAEESEKSYTSTVISLQKATENYEKTKELAVLKKVEYENVLQHKEESYPILLQKQSNLNQALELSTIVAKIKNEVESLRKEYKDNQVTIKKMDLEKSTLINEREKISTKLLEIINKKEKLQIPPEYRILVDNGLKSEESFKRQLQKKDEIEKRYILSIRESEKIAQDLINKNNEYNKIGKTLFELRERLERLQCPGDSELLIDRQKECVELSARLAQGKKIEEKLFQLENRSKELSIEETELNKKINDIIKQLEKIEVEIQKTAEEKERFHLSDIAAILAETLKEGEPCKVCGSTNHPSPAKKLVEHIEEQLTVRLSESKEKEGKLQQILAGNRIEYGKIENELKLLTDEIKSQKDSLYKELQGEDLRLASNRLKQLTENFEKLQISISNYEKDKLQLDKDCQKAEKELSTINEARAAITEKNSFINEQKQLLEKEKEEALLQLKENENEYKLLLDELKAENIYELKNGIDKADQQLPKIEKDEKEIRDRQQQLSKELELLSENETKFKLQQQQLFVVGKEKSEQIEKELDKISVLSEGKEINTYILEIKKAIEELLVKEKIKKQEYENTQKNAVDAESEKNKQNGVFVLHKEAYTKSKDELNHQLQHYEIDIISAKENFLTDNEITDIEKTIESFRDERAITEQNIVRLEKKLDGVVVNESEIVETQAKLKDRNENFTNFSNRIAVIEESIKKTNDCLEIVEKLRKDEKNLSYKLSLTSTLKQMLVGNRFIEFIAKSDLEYITHEASRRLLKITKGRYALEYDGKEFVMRDDNWGGYRRTANSLSGGEIFLTSLSLALALSTKIQLKSAPLEFFFLDEGFGTLDSSLLDIVMSSLESLHNDRMAIGLITHVDELKSRLPIKLVVDPAQKGGSGTKITMD